MVNGGLTNYLSYKDMDLNNKTLEELVEYLFVIVYKCKHLRFHTPTFYHNNLSLSINI